MEKSRDGEHTKNSRDSKMVTPIGPFTVFMYQAKPVIWFIVF